MTPRGPNESTPAPAPLVIEDLLELPRPGAATANATSTLALWPSTEFNFSTSRTNKTLSLVDLASTGGAAPRTILAGLTSTEHVWLDETTFLFLRLPGEELARVRVEKNLGAENADDRMDHQGHVSDKAQAELVKAVRELSPAMEVWAKDVLEGTEYQVGTLPVVPSNLVLVASETGSVLAFSAAVFPDGDPYKVEENKKKQKKEAKGSDIRVYDSVFVRHWDEWIDPAGVLTQLHVVRLSKAADTEEDGFEHVDMPETEEGRWSFIGTREPGLTTKRPTIFSPLAGTKLECPVGAFGGSGDFSLSSTHIVFHSKDPHVNPAWHTRTQVYLVPLSPKSAKDAIPKKLTVGTQGACASPTFSVDGTRVSWLEMREDGYEADRNRVMVYELATGERWGATEEWDRSPGSVKWCPCGEKVFLVAEEEGHAKLWSLSVPLTGRTSPPAEPAVVTRKHTITSVSPLSTSLLLLTSNSFTSPNTLSLLSLPANAPPVPLATLTPSLAQTTSLDPGESFWFAGALGREVHGFIFFPPGAKDAANKGKKWPLAFLVHGGPQSAWTDSWSTRWNPNTYASHGYITVAINPTGSTGYGQKFCDDIKNNWGGLPFHDLVAGLEFVKTAFPEIDPERMAMLGASYGGYQANWIQGHNSAMGFKCIVCHDGVFSTTNTWFSTEELYFPEREFGGTPWQVPENYSKWNPQNHIAKWKTPQLVIHSARDYRLTESEGLGVFNTLQRLGVPSRLLHFPSENHWILEPHNGVRWHEEVLRWIDEWTAEPEDRKDDQIM